MKKKKPQDKYAPIKYATVNNVMSLVMKLEIEIKTKLVEFQERLEMLEKKQKDVRYCKKCKKITPYLKCGYGTPGSFVGNARFRCLVCKTEGI